MSNTTPKRMSSGSTLMVSVDGKVVPLISSEQKPAEKPITTKDTESKAK